MSWMLDDTSPVPHWRPLEARSGIRLAFSTRRGGVSAPPFDSLNLGRSTADDPAAVAKNRERLIATLALPADRLVTAGQVHGTRVVEVNAPGHVSECDGLATTARGLVLAVTTADCMALLFTAPGAVAAVHAGWRGTADAMPRAALDAICGLASCGPGSVDVYIGPCIRGCCYEVGEDVAARFPKAAERRTPGKPRLDLPTAARDALVAAGVPASSLHDTGACTACEPHWYFSHRRDRGRTGRLWGVAALLD